MTIHKTIVQIWITQEEVEVAEVEEDHQWEKEITMGQLVADQTLEAVEDHLGENSGVVIAERSEAIEEVEESLDLRVMSPRKDP